MYFIFLYVRFMRFSKGFNVGLSVHI